MADLEFSAVIFDPGRATPMAKEQLEVVLVLYGYKGLVADWWTELVGITATLDPRNPFVNQSISEIENG
jgi:hypothetical protein